jgi:hypothetical protein
MAKRNMLQSLEEGVDAWNLWRTKDQAIRPDVSGTRSAGTWPGRLFQMLIP